MCHASQDDGYLVFEDLDFQFRGILDEQQLKDNLDFLVDNRFIHKVNSSEYIESKSFGWHRNNNKDTKPENSTVFSDRFEQIVN